MRLWLARMAVIMGLWLALRTAMVTMKMRKRKKINGGLSRVLGAADDDSQGPGAVSLCALVFRVMVGVLWWSLVGAEGDFFLSLVVWESALRLADFFRRQPEVLCLYFAFLEALPYLIFSYTAIRLTLLPCLPVRLVNINSK